MNAPNVIPIKPITAVEAAFKYPPEWRFCIIRSGGKKPTLARWNEIGNAFVPTQLDPGTTGIGLLHRWSETASLDLDNMDEARAWLAERGIDLDALLNADDACQISSGREGKGKLLYKLPVGRAMETKRIVKDMATFLEFRNSDKGGNSVQCCLPPTIHPVTCQPYTWGGKGHYSALPTLPEALLKVWEGLIEADKVPRVSIRGEHGASAEEVASAVAFCDPDSDRTPWVQVGMALKLELGDAGCQIWDEWSRKSAKYPGEQEMVHQWRSFKNDHPNPVTVGTIFHHARANGWQRPAPDMLRLFNQINKTYEQLMVEIFPAIPHISRELAPGVMGEYAFEVAERVGCDPTVSVLAGIAAVAGAANAGSTLYVNSEFVVHPIVRCLTVADPSDKKSPGSKPMFKPLGEIEKDDFARYQMDMQRWEAEEAMYASAKKAFLQQAGGAEHALNTGGGDPLAGLAQLPVLRAKPVPKRLMIDDVTSQKAALMLCERPEGLLMYADEGRQWLRRATDPRSGDNLSFWTRSYEGGHYNLDRVGSGSTPVPNCAISVYANVQPSVLEAVLPLLMIDGGQARIIFGVLDTSLIGPGDLDDVPDWMTRREEYGQMIRLAHAQPATEYRLSPEARQVFKAWNEWTTGASKHAKAAGWGKLLEGFAGKASGLALRIALIFHLADRPAEVVVSSDTMKLAIRFVREFAMPQVDYIDKANIGAKIQQWLTNYILKHCERETVSLSDLRRVLEKNELGNEMEKREKEERILSGMEQLALQGWVAMVEVKGSKSTHWAISPKLKVVFSEQIEGLKKDTAEYHFNA